MASDPVRENLIRACMAEYPNLDRTLVELAINFHERCESKYGKKYKPEKIISKLKPVSIPKATEVKVLSPEPRLLPADDTPTPPPLPGSTE